MAYQRPVKIRRDVLHAVLRVSRPVKRGALATRVPRVRPANDAIEIGYAEIDQFVRVPPACGRKQLHVTADLVPQFRGRETGDRECLGGCHYAIDNFVHAGQLLNQPKRAVSEGTPEALTASCRRSLFGSYLTLQVKCDKIEII